MSMSTATTNGRPPRAEKPNRIERVANWATSALGLGDPEEATMRKVFPDHWSFMLGEIALCGASSSCC